MNSALIKVFTFSTLGFIALVAPAACGGGGSGGSGSGAGGTGGGGVQELCLLATNCATDDDCGMGTHCNLAVSPPQCDKLYCEAVGAPCSEAATCKEGLDCDGDLSRCCLSAGSACEKDEDCCAEYLHSDYVPSTCSSGVCTKPCLGQGSYCDVDEDCCSGLVCNPDDNGYYHCEKTSQCASCNDWLQIAGTPYDSLCADPQLALDDLWACGCDLCAVECSSGTTCDNFIAAIGDCATCLQDQCGAEYSACAAN